MKMKICFLAVLAAGVLAASSETASLKTARDHQDIAALDHYIAQYETAAKTKPQSADIQYKLALAQSYAAEVAMEAHDKRKSEAYAEAGMEPIEKAVQIDGNDAEYHRLHGALCGQVIPANPLLGALKY